MHRSNVMLVAFWLLASAVSAQLPVQDAPVDDPVGGANDVVGDAEAEAQAAAEAAAESAGGVTTSAAAVANATAAGIDATAQGTANASLSADPPTYRVQWRFDLPLDGDSFRLRADDESHRDRVQVTVHWQQGGRAGDVGDVTLHARHDDERLEHVSAASNGTAVFVLDAATLYRGAHTDWALAASIDDGVHYWAAYDPQGSDATPYTDNVRVSWAAQPIWAHDSDEDGHPDDIDNCPQTPNDQSNLDGDVHGDACDDDIDGDGWSNDEEAAAGSDAWNEASTPDDRDADGHNNSAEAAAGSDPDDPASTPDDPDADGYNNTQETAAGSDTHNATSTPVDPDADGVHSDEDNCPRDANPDQADADGDRIGDTCDTRPDDGPLGDHDGDGSENRADNCPGVHNPDQADMDGDRRGDVCDTDIDGDGHVNVAEPFPEDPAEWSDNDGDGQGDNADADDDNDGLSDSAEASTGTDPLVADTDGDHYSDLDELQLGTDGTDRYSPDFRPTRVAVTGDNGTATITWADRGDERVKGYVVWSREDRRIIGTVEGAQGGRIIDAQARNDTTYMVQAVLDADGFTPMPADAVPAVLRVSGSAREASGAPTGLADGAANDDGLAPAQESPGLPLVALLVVLAWAARRR